MGEIVCTEEGGWQGITAALTQARSGDVVQLRSGHYAGGETLFVPSGVSLVGEAGVSLCFDADAPAVRFREVEGSRLANLKINMLATSVLRRTFPEDPASDEEVRVEWGLVYVESSRGIRICTVEIEASSGGLRYLNPIALRASANCTISDCRIGFSGRNGIRLSTSEALIHRNHVSGMINGISLARSSLNLDQPSRARIEDNTCHANTQAGIALFSSEADAIAGNECWENQASGILLQRDPLTPDQPSRARIDSNRCHHNTHAGIILLSSDAETITGNESWANQFHGIALEPDPSSRQHPSRARIEHNRCYENIQSGIMLFSSEVQAIAHNECWANQFHGIALEPDPSSRQHPSRTRIEHNRYYENIQSGIMLFSSEAQAIAHNECWGNQHCGIALWRDHDSQEQPSRARIERNLCHHNIDSGIGLFSSEAEAIADNECWENHRCGIALERDPVSGAQPSRARIENNRCHNNFKAGIVLSSSEAEVIADNECWRNQMHGIALERDKKSSDQPSRARIERNRCHNNIECGIILFSSESEAISGNECWANQCQGIMLQRDLRSCDQPSRARIAGNRCHNNIRSGITLFSSEAEAIAGNECWANKLNGIALERDAESPDQPSRARITGNRCHDNNNAGIVLLSGEAEAIVDNECWANLLSGIILQRAPRNADQPSRALIDSNRCHGNAQSGIVLMSSEAEAIADNECWANQFHGIALEGHPNNPDQPSRARIAGNSCDHNGGAGFALLGSQVLEFGRNRIWNNVAPSLIPHPGGSDLQLPWTAPEQALATSPDSEAPSRRRARSRGGVLAERLTQAGYDDVDALARFATGMGCPGCLAAAWKSGGNAGAPNRTVAIHPEGERKHEGRVYHLTPSGSADSVVFVATGRSCLTDRLWHFARRTALGQKARVMVIGVLGGLRNDLLDPITADLQLIREAERGDEQRLLTEAGICHSAFAALGRQGRRVGALLDIDCAPRVALAMTGATPDYPFLQRGTLGEASVWWARFGILLRPLPLLTLAAAIGGFEVVLAALGHWKGYAGSLRNVSGAAWYYLTATIGGSQLGDWRAVAAIAVFLPVSLVTAANWLFLPRILRVKLPVWMHDLASLFVGLQRWFPEGNDRRAALRWVGRRLFGGGSTQGLALLALRHPDLWNADDLDRLQALVRSRPRDQSLAVIVPICHPTQIASGLLKPWIDPVTRQPRPGLSADIDLIVLPDTSATQAETAPPADPTNLLGVDTPPDEAARRRVYNSLRDDRLTIHDLVPLLVFGSMPESPFVIAYDEQNTSPSIDVAIEAYARFISSDPAERPIPVKPAEAETHVARSAATLIHVARAGRRTIRRLIGRGTHREELKAALQQVFVNTADLEGYVRVFAGCGQLFNLREVARLLAVDELSADVAGRIVRHLRAAAALAQTGEPFPASSHRLEMLIEVWGQVAERLPVAKVANSVGLGALAVEMIGLAFGAAAPRPEEASLRLLDLIESFDREPGAEPAGTLHDILVGEIGRALSALSELEPDYADRLLARQLAGPWRSIATSARTRLNERLTELRAAIPTLTDRLARADVYEAFAVLLQAHRGDLPRFMTRCYCLAARSATDTDRQQRLAEAMVKHRATGLQICADIHIDAPRRIGTIIEHLADPRTHELLRQAVRADEAEDDDGEYVYLDSFDLPSAEVRNVIEIILTGRVRAA